ncbi:uncharacterized protein LOC136064428 [Quercus suber]|uniref:uncharacterized protein LOC136062512 n=1 Tax=Quercus suber TaxID=58331 RepID=UPI0032DEE61C
MEVSLGQFVKMNILMWNCRGMLNHRPSIMVITETRVGGDRVRRIIEGLPFDRSITTNTIGFAGGLWLLWKKEDAELLLGYFNEIPCGEDKYRGRQVNINRALEFKECIDNCNMIDLGFVGLKYTWINKRPIADLILERIDRYFANPGWHIMYPKAVVTHLPRTFYDHHPVLVELNRPFPNATNRPFQKVRKWNMEVFGNVFAKKRRVLARINGVQKSLAISPNESLLRLEKQLIEEYASILLQEEEFWALKSRLNAAPFGD